LYLSYVISNKKDSDIIQKLHILKQKKIKHVLKNMSSQHAGFLAQE